MSGAARRQPIAPGVFQVTMPSPLGPIHLRASDAALLGVHLASEPEPAGAGERAEHHPILTRARDELSEYFAGSRQTFTVPLGMEGTAFQCRVWRALCDIPFGERCSYAQLAEAIGQPRACRAVGSANGCNRLPIIVPCHRVIGAGGRLGGYSGGLEIKRWLLDHERAVKAGQAAALSPAAGALLFH